MFVKYLNNEKFLSACQLWRHHMWSLKKKKFEIQGFGRTETIHKKGKKHYKTIIEVVHTTHTLYFKSSECMK